MNYKTAFKGISRKSCLAPVLSGVILVVASGAAWGATAIEGSDNNAPTAATLEGACSSYDYDAYIGQVGYATAGGGVTTKEGINPSPNYNDSSMINSAYNQFEAGHGIGVGSSFVISGVADSGLTPSNANAYTWGEDQGSAAVLYLATTMQQ